jgi:excisionase family DNA binding protein
MTLDEVYCTTGQAAKRLGVNRLTIQRWVKAGKLSGERVGNVTLIPIVEVERLGENFE